MARPECSGRAILVSSRSDVNGGEVGVKRESVPTTDGGDVSDSAAIRFAEGGGYCEGRCYPDWVR